MDVSEYYTNPLDIHSGNIGSNIGGSRPSSASEQMRPDLSDNLQIHFTGELRL